MIAFRYNSYHKIITVAIVIIWAVVHFTNKSDQGEYYSNGQIKNSGSYSNGKNHGKWIWYYENGNKKMDGNFNYGKRTGVWNTWDEKGRLLTKGNYQNDKLNGDYKRFNASGELIEQLNYKNDILIEKQLVNSSIPDSGNSKK